MADSLSSITGLSSGIDSKALVDSMMAIEHRPVDRMQATVDANAKRSKALEDFKSRLDALKAAAAALTDGTAFDSYSSTVAGVSSSGRALFTAVAGSGAVPGAYEVKVLGLAKTQKYTASVGQTSATTALGFQGSFELRRPDSSVIGSVTLDGSETLEGIRDKINTAAGTSKIQATIVSTKADGSDQRLVLSSQQSGVAGGFTLATTALGPDVPVDTDGDGVDDSTVPGPDPLAQLGLDAPIEQPAADAKVQIDGVTFTRPTNTITDAIKGVTLNLSAEDLNASATLTVDRVKGAPVSAVKGFVDAYNALQSYVKAQTAPGAALSGEPMARTVRGALSNLVLTKGTGLPSDLATLGSVGVSLNKDGTLAFDQTRFDAAYSSRYDELKSTLADRMGAMSKFADSFTKPLTGSIAQRETALTDQSSRLTDRIADVESRLEKKRAALLAQFAKFEASLGTINAMGKSLTSQLAGLNSSSDSSNS